MSGYLDRKPRALWKATADADRANYFRWTFGEYVVSVGKAWRDRDRLTHCAGPDTCEVLLFRKTATRVDLFPSDLDPALVPFDHMFGDHGEGNPIACHMSDSILDSLLFALAWYFGPATEYKGITL